jgi:predicted metal-binding membrane protein
MACSRTSSGLLATSARQGDGHVHSLHAAPGAWFAGTLSLTAIWFAMMTAMMAPVVWPWARAIRRFAAHDNRTAATVAFLGGYGVAWLLYSVLAAIVQIILSRQVGLDAMRGLPSTAAGIALIAAGAVQFTGLKRACLTHCRSPLSYLLARWRNRPTHAWRIGFGHGAFCVGCCWALMASMLAVGMANLWWMLAIAAATFLEQVTPGGELVGNAIGLALLLIGSANLL